MQYPLFMKTCSSCKQDKPTDDFANNKSSPDGLDYYCRECKRAKYLARKEAACSKARELYSEKREDILAHKKQYYLENKESKQEYNQEYYEYNRNKIRQQQAQWSKNNPDKKREHSARRRALIMNATVDMPDNYWQILLDTFGPFCMNPECKNEDPVLTHDHVIPLAKDGEHSLRNSQILCSRCNSSKGTKTIDYRRLEE